MYNPGRSVRALFRKQPKLPALSGTAFVFGAAPEPFVPRELLDTAWIVTANASQVYLERFGIDKPAVTFMRSNMGLGAPTDAVKQDALRDRSTGLLLLFASRHDPDCVEQLEILDRVNYRYDNLRVMDRLECCMIHNRLLDAKVPFLIKRFRPSMGMRAILFSLDMGADQVAVSGISLRVGGWSISDMSYDMQHVQGDVECFERIRRLRLPVLAVEEQLAADTGLPRWQGNWAPGALSPNVTEPPAQPDAVQPPQGAASVQ